MTNNPFNAYLSRRVWLPLKLKARYDNFIGGDWVARWTASITKT